MVLKSKDQGTGKRLRESMPITLRLPTAKTHLPSDLNQEGDIQLGGWCRAAVYFGMKLKKVIMTGY